MIIFIVSIPAGFSDALRPVVYFTTYFPSIVVSIPAGFSDALRRQDFRSLTLHITAVSIPAGFSDALRHGDRLDDSGRDVSIPAGFSDALRPICAISTVFILVCFNPCWVF